MKQVSFSIFFLFIAIQSFAQASLLNQYRFVNVSDRFEFQKASDQYQLNSMTKFYLNKYGFNTFLSSESPNVDRCDGLYAEVEDLKAIFGTKLQLVLRDCNGKEIYRSPEGRSKLKEHEKSYQDALRKALDKIEGLHVNQSDMIVLADQHLIGDGHINNKVSELPNTKLELNPRLNLPVENSINYTSEGESYILKRTGDGYSLYKESEVEGEVLGLLGKIIVMDKLVKFMDVSGKVNDAVFNNSGELSIGTGTSSKVFIKEGS